MLSRDSGKYRFEYNKAYANSKNAVALGPEFELWKDEFTSSKLFPSLADRIPSKNNPAYADYCRQWGISEDETDPFLLLPTIGRRGPSTFVFEAMPEGYGPEEIKRFRDRLGLSQREFSRLFHITQATLSGLELGKVQNATIRLLMKLCDQVPDALSWLLRERGYHLHDNKRAELEGR